VTIAVLTAGGRRRASLAAALLVVALLPTGCGQAEPEALATPTAAPTPTATPEPSPVGTPTPVATQAPVAPAAPVALTIPSIGIDSDVIPVGTEDRVLQIPPEPWVVGWWKDGVPPGAGYGAVILTAHLDSRTYGAGPFTRAKDLVPGAEATMRDVNGVVRAFRVSDVTTYEKQALPYEQLFAQDGPERVVLVTCGGEYDPDAGGWDSNVVVTFTPA
jgi:hypothetical protein